MNIGKLSEFLEENDGSFSATRLAFLLWAIGVLTVWIIVSLQKWALQPIDGSISTILGILMTGKVIQKFGEKPDLTQAAPPANNQP